ncbi:MAG: sulfatase [Acidobacteriota bacterium]
MPRLALSILVLAVGFLLGCQPGETSGVPGAADGAIELAGDSVLLSAAPLEAGIGRRWEIEEACSCWRFRDFAALRVHIGRGSPGPLEIHLEPVDDTARQWFEIDWDGTWIDSSSPTSFVVPESLATAGVHELKIRRQPSREPWEKLSRWSRFAAIELRRGANRRLTPERHDGLRKIAEHLELGATGVGKVKRRGILAVGPQSGAIDLGPGQPDRFSLTGVNLSSSPARVELRVGRETMSADLAGKAEHHFATELTEEPGPVKFTVDGAAEGLVLLGEPSAFSTQDERTPIILITLDSTRADVLSPYGAAPEATPALARFARDATVYDTAYSTAPWTLAAHASMFTGLYPSHHGAGVTDATLRAEHPTLASRLRQAGYFTAGYAGGYMCANHFGIARGFDRYHDPESFETRGDRLRAAAEAFLSQAGSRPFFLFVNFFDPHWRYAPPAPYGQHYGLTEHETGLRQLPEWQAAFDGEAGAWRRIYVGEETLGRAAQDYLRAAYAAEVAYMDEQLGLLLDRLRALELYDRALIVITADHGELLGEDGWFVGHSYRLADELVRVPLLVKWPFQTTGERSQRLVSLIDLFPTLLQAGLGEAVAETDPAEGSQSANGAHTGLPDAALRPLDLRSAQRHRLVLSEEHASLIHPLEPPRLVAKHLYRVQRPHFRQIVWPGHGECARLEASGWSPEPCPVDSETMLEGLDKVLRRRASEEQVSGIDEASREALTALGYL